MDLSKDFGTINHSLILDKLEAYGFSMASLKLLPSYLCNRFQRTSVNASFSDWKQINRSYKISIFYMNPKLHKSKELNEIIENQNSEYINITKNLQIEG